jgi:hypothetical protein
VSESIGRNLICRRRSASLHPAPDRYTEKEVARASTSDTIDVPGSRSCYEPHA